jgi:hypothetical protein
MTKNSIQTEGGLLLQEAENFAKYILKKMPDRLSLEHYVQIISQGDSYSQNTSDAKLLKFAMSHPWSIGLIDSYLAFFRPDSEFRFRLYVMFAILESNRNYVDDFLPVERSPFYALSILYVGLKTALKVPCGFIVSFIARAV